MRKLVFLLLLTCSIIAYLYLTGSYKKPTHNQLNEMPTQIENKAPSELSKQNYTASEDSISENGSNIYINPTLRYSFEYSRDSTIFKCKDIPCVSLDDQTIRVEPLDFLSITGDLNEMDGLLAEDFYCNASGPQESKDCVNVKLEKYTNSNGVMGYKLYRNVTISKWNQSTQRFDDENYDDYAFLFSLNNSHYPSVIFAVDEPSDVNHNKLEKIINTFKVY